LRIASVKTFFILACLLITALNQGYSQTSGKPDSIAVATDTLKQTSGGSFLDDKVNYKAEDSTTADLNHKKAFLYNHAEVYYQDMTLKAGYIEIDFEKKLITARGIPDSSGKIVQRPVFEQGEDKFTAGEIIYNTDSKKGKIKDVLTQQGDGYIHGSDIKKDTNNMYYVASGRYTTCDLEDEPHYYLFAKKIKVIPNDKIITGPAELYIADVPTPLILPFGYFPNKKGRRSGLVMPSYGESNFLGFFLSNGGFYYGGNEKFDLTLLGDIYSNGGFATRNSCNYNKRYLYSGNVGFNYARMFGPSANPELAHQPMINSYQLLWGHSQDPRSHPNSRFQAQVTLATTTYNKYNSSVTNGYLNTNNISNISYYRGFAGTPITMNVSGRAAQNLLTKTIDITLPSLNVNMGTITPFKNENRIGKRWYDQVRVSASLMASNSIATYDSLLFKEQTLRKMRNGVNLNVPITTTFTVLKYIQVNPSISTNSNLYFQTINKRYDSITHKIIVDTLGGIKASTEARASVGLTTKLFGDYFFKTKHLKQIHHVITPGVSVGYHPDYSQSQYGYYRTVHDSTGVAIPYSIFEGGALSNGPTAGKEGSVSFTLNNTLEAKMRQNTDSGSVDKKISLLDNINASVSYNAAAQHFKWSPISLSARTRLFNTFDISAGGTYDPYLRIDGRRADTLEISNGRLAHLSGLNASISTSFRSKEKKKESGNKSKLTAPTIPVTSREELQYMIDHPNMYVDFDVPWSLNIYYNAYYTVPINNNESASKSNQFTQSITFNGDLTLTKNWKISGSSGFDFVSKKLTVTSINVYRDLHCWELHFNWVPFGFRQSFLLTINVKSSMLKDLRVKKQSAETQGIPRY
jgi:lipopolysaccharide assembly outer membrane protein LptD (OstA)